MLMQWIITTSYLIKTINIQAKLHAVYQILQATTL